MDDKLPSFLEASSLKEFIPAIREGGLDDVWEYVAEKDEDRYQGGTRRKSQAALIPSPEYETLRSFDVEELEGLCLDDSLPGGGLVWRLADSFDFQLGLSSCGESTNFCHVRRGRHLRFPIRDDNLPFNTSCASSA